jgi:hypothetical protein
VNCRRKKSKNVIAVAPIIFQDTIHKNTDLNIFCYAVMLVLFDSGILLG